MSNLTVKLEGEELKHYLFERFKKHDNDELGSLATPCNRCDLPFTLQTDIPRRGWQGLPCKAEPYTSSELFKLDRFFLSTYPVTAADFRVQCSKCYQLWTDSEFANQCGDHVIRADGNIRQTFNLLSAVYRGQQLQPKQRESTMNWLDLLLQLDDEVIDDSANLELEILEAWNDRRQKNYI